MTRVITRAASDETEVAPESSRQLDTLRLADMWLLAVEDGNHALADHCEEVLRSARHHTAAPNSVRACVRALSL